MARKFPKPSVGKAVNKAIRDVPAPSPNTMTNLIIADLALRGGGRLLRNAVERTVLGRKFSPEKASNIVAGRTMAQTLLGTAIARIATRSVPGAILVGGGLLAKTLYDRKQGKTASRKGDRAVEKQADNGDDAAPKA